MSIKHDFEGDDVKKNIRINKKEEKRREGLYTGGALQNKNDSNKIGFSEEKNEKGKTLNLNGRIYFKNINYIKRVQRKYLNEINIYEKIKKLEGIITLNFLIKAHLLYRVIASFIKLKFKIVILIYDISFQKKILYINNTLGADNEIYLNKIKIVRKDKKFYFIILIFKCSNITESLCETNSFSPNNNLKKIQDYNLTIFIKNNAIIILVLKIKILAKKKENIYLKDETYKKMILIKNSFFEIKKILNKNRNEKSTNNKYFINFQKRILLTICYLIIIINSFVQILPNDEKYLFKFSSFITLKIKGTGNKYLFGKNSNFNNNLYPDELIINNDIKVLKNNNNFNKHDLDQINNTIKLVWYDNINNCQYLFSGCSDITEIDLSNFNSSEVTVMSQMFEGCSSLTSINFSNFDTSQVTDMESMFNGCSSLTSLNLSNFNTENIIDLQFMFYDCSKLRSLDLSNFNTSKLRDMSRMFNGCSSLTILNLSNFDTSQVTEMNNLFFDCSKLTSLNLSNFDFSKVYAITNMFYGCINLKYINLKNYNEKSLTKNGNIFYNVPDNIVICLNKSNNISILLSQIQNKNCYNIDCSDNWNSNQKIIINETGKCIDNCKSDNIYENNIKCYENCQKGIILNNGLCTKCNDSYYPIENDPLNIEKDYIICYKELKGYYIDKKDFLYKKCYFTCETC